MKLIARLKSPAIYIIIMTTKDESNKDDLEVLLDEVFQIFVENMPPATSREEPLSDMTTLEIYQIFNDHCPDCITPGKLAAMLRNNGYISNYDPHDRQFTWLIRR